MNREEVSSKLALISPCLGKQDFVEVLKHICFDDGRAISFNGTQAAMIDFDLEYSCTVPGNLLQKLINSYSTEEIELKQVDDKLVVSSGASIAKLNTFSSDDFVFDVPDSDDETTSIEVDEDFIKGISKCLISVSDNFIEKSQSGITLDAHKGGVFLYSTDDVCLSKYTTNQKSETSAKMILPKLFCTQLIAWQRALGDGILYIGFDYVEAAFDEGKATLFSKIDPEDVFLDFEDVIQQSYFDDTEVIVTPPELKEVLQRCLLITSGNADQFVTIEIDEDDNASFLAESKNSVHNITDKVKLNGIAEDCSFNMDCNLLLRGLENVDQMTFSSENPVGLDTVFFIGKSDNFLHLINSI